MRTKWQSGIAAGDAAARHLKGNRLIGNERYAAGKSNPYLSRKIYLFSRRRLSDFTLVGGCFLEKDKTRKREKERLAQPMASDCVFDGDVAVRNLDTGFGIDAGRCGHGNRSFDFTALYRPWYPV